MVHYATAGLGKLVPRRNQPVSFCLSRTNQVSKSWHKTARPCPPNISSHPSISKSRSREQNLVTHSVSLQCVNSNHHRSHKIRLRDNTVHPTKTANPRSFIMARLKPRCRKQPPVVTAICNIRDPPDSCGTEMHCGLLIGGLCFLARCKPGWRLGVVAASLGLTTFRVSNFIRS